VDGDRHGLTDPNRLPRWFVAAIVAPPALFVAVFYVWPVATLFARGLGGDVIIDTLENSTTWRVLWFTLWQATASTVLTLVIGLAPAWAVSRFAFPGRRALLGLLTAVFVMPTVVVGAAFVALLPESLDHSIWAILGAHVVFNLAVVVRLVGAVWEALPHDLEHAAATLGASRWRVFVDVTFPLIRGSLAAAASIVFLFTFTSFGVIRVLGTPGTTTLEVEVWRRATQLGDVGGAAVLTLLQLGILAAVVMWSARYQRRHAHTVRLRGTSGRGRPDGAQRWGVLAAVGGAALLVALPLFALVERSFRSRDGYSIEAWRSLGDNEIRPGLTLGIDPLDAMRHSVENALWATGISVMLGAAAVLAIVSLGRAGKLLDTGLMLPLGTSAVTIGFGMLITFDSPPVDWRAEWWLVPVGHALVALPFVVRSALAVLRSIDPDLRAAAATLGANPVRAWATTTLPFLRRPLATGAGLAAAISLGEFGATSFLSRSGSETVPIVIERLLGRTGGSFQAQAFALSTLLAIATVSIVMLVDAAGAAIGPTSRPTNGSSGGNRARRS